MRAMRSRLALALLSFVALLTLAACGGSDTASSSGPGAAASVVPADAVAFIDISSDLDSAQWKQVQTLAERFPGKDKAGRQILDALGKQDIDWKADVEPALGPETAIAVIRVRSETQVVVLTKPDDKAKLDTINAVNQVRARGAYVVAIAPENYSHFDFHLEVPETGGGGTDAGSPEGEAGNDRSSTSWESR